MGGSNPTRKTSQGNQHQKFQNRITVLLFAMVLLSAALWTPFNVITIIFDHFHKTVKFHAGMLQKLDLAFQLLGYASLYLNSFLYGFLNTNYRSKLKTAVSTSLPNPMKQSRGHSSRVLTVPDSRWPWSKSAASPKRSHRGLPRTSLMPGLRHVASHSAGHQKVTAL